MTFFFLEHAVNYNEITTRLHEGNASNSMERTEEEPKFLDTINPLLSFTKADLAAMDQEFDQFFDESDSSSDDNEPVDLGESKLSRFNTVHDFTLQFYIENPPIDKVLKKKRKKEDEKEHVQAAKLFCPDKEASTSTKTSEKTKRNFEVNASSSSSSGEDNTEEKPDDPDESPSARFRRGCDLPSDLDMDSDYSQGSQDPIDDDDGEWVSMGSALEREFLGLE